MRDPDKICGITKRDGTICQAYAMPNGRCRVHGGLTPKGPDSPHFKDGKHSLYYLPTKLKAIAESIPAEFDKGILSRNTLLTEAFIRQKLEQLENAPDSADVWDALRKELDSLVANFTDENYGRVAVSLDKIGRLIDERQLYHQTVGEIRKDLAEQRANQKAIADIEFKGQNAIPVSQLIKFLMLIMEDAKEIFSIKAELYSFYDRVDKRINSKQAAPMLSEGNSDE